MVDAALMPAIKAALKENEIGNSDPYQLSFALKGQSGASFGVFQGDTAADPNALATLRNVLTTVPDPSLPPDKVTAILNALSVPCPADPLASADEQLIDSLLHQPAGQALVDAMDAKILTGLCADLDLANSTVAAVGNTIVPAAQIAICLWCNMSGPPTLLLSWLKGNPVTIGTLVAAPPGNPVSLDDMERYLRLSSFFRNNSGNFTHFVASVSVGIEQLP